MMTASESQVLTEIRDLLKKLVTVLVDEPREYEKARLEVNKKVTAAIQGLADWAKEAGPSNLREESNWG
jgi:hypothetical protein